MKSESTQVTEVTKNVIENITKNIHEVKQPMEIHHTHETLNHYTDSIEIVKGTPGKEGSVSFKVYVNASDPKEARQRLDNMIDLRSYAISRVLESNATMIQTDVKENVEKLKEVLKK